MSNDSNVFSTEQVRAWNAPQLLNSADIPLTPVNLGFPIGLAQLDIDKTRNIRIKSYTDNVTQKSVRVHLDAWADTILYSATATWLEANNKDRDIQYGTFATTDDHPWDKPQLQTSRYIKFAKPYAEPPKVVVWLNALDIDQSKNWRVKTYTSDIKADGFTLHIDTWADTILYLGSATWIAHPANRTDIASGTYSTQDVRAWDKPQATTGGKANFDRRFQRTPRVIAALNSIDIDHNANLRVRSTTNNITTGGLGWNLDSWADTILYSAGASYLALQDF